MCSVRRPRRGGCQRARDLLNTHHCLISMCNIKNEQNFWYYNIILHHITYYYIILYITYYYIILWCNRLYCEIFFSQNTSITIPCLSIIDTHTEVAKIEAPVAYFCVPGTYGVYQDLLLLDLRDSLVPQTLFRSSLQKYACFFQVVDKITLCLF